MATIYTTSSAKHEVDGTIRRIQGRIAKAKEEGADFVTLPTPSGGRIAILASAIETIETPAAAETAEG